MMDIVERLRDPVTHGAFNLCRDAAADIERLRTHIAELEIERGLLRNAQADWTARIAELEGALKALFDWAEIALSSMADIPLKETCVGKVARAALAEDKEEEE